MDRLRTILISGAGVALAVTALAMPAAAADTKGTLAIVNGIPGAKVDVCLNGDEVKSNLAYGGHVFQNDKGTGAKSLKFLARDPRRCKGTQLGQTTFTLDPAEDLTIVVTKKATKVLTYDNATLGEIPPRGTPFPYSFAIWRHASEMPVNFRYRIWTASGEVPTTPVADPIYGKGRWGGVTIGPEYVFQIRARSPEAVETLALDRILISASRRFEWILVGTNPGNARLVAPDRVISQPSP